MLPFIELPSPGEELTIKVLGCSLPDPRKKNRELGERVLKCCIYGNDDECYNLKLRSFIIKELLKECKNNNIQIDSDLRCCIGKVFTIFGKRRTDAHKRMWHKNVITGKLEAPIIHRLKLIK